MFLGQKLPFLLSGLPHSLQPSFWPKPRALHVLMTLSHPQHSQPCSHLLAPGPCPAGASLSAPFGAAHSPPGSGGFQGTAGADSTATSGQIFWNNRSLLPMVCQGAPVPSLVLGLQLGQLAEPGPSSPVLPFQHSQVMAVTSHPRAAVHSPELLLQPEVIQRQSRDKGLHVSDRSC